MGFPRAPIPINRQALSGSEAPCLQWNHTETRVFVSTPSGVIGIHVQDASENVTRKYLHKDHLGSIVAVSGAKAAGNIALLLAEYSFDSWGKHRNVSDWSPMSGGSSASTTASADRGYTGHEMLDAVGLVHMNGRIYDSNIGRFLSADPIVQAPSDLQSYNRYAYVRNNPLTLTDPSGFSWWSKNVTRKVSDFSKKYWKTITTVVISVGATVVAGIITAPAGPIISGMISGFAGGFSAGFAGSLLHGGSIGDALKTGNEAGIKGEIIGGAIGLVSHYFQTFAQLTLTIKIAQAAAHGAATAAVEAAYGGSWEASFFAGFGGSMTGQFMSKSTIAWKTTAGALVGGTVSEIGGGKFANGALTGALTAMTAAASGAAARRMGIGPNGPRGPAGFDVSDRGNYRISIYPARRHPGIYEQLDEAINALDSMQKVSDLVGYLEVAANAGTGNLSGAAVAWMKTELSMDLTKFMAGGGSLAIKAIGNQVGWNVSVQKIRVEYRFFGGKTIIPESGWHKLSIGALNSYERGLYPTYREAYRAGQFYLNEIDGI